MAGQGRHRGPFAITVETLVRNINHLGELAETERFVLLTLRSEEGVFVTPSVGVP